MYKYPFNSIVSIFLPLWLLAIINLAIFYQDYALGSRIAAIASLMVAYVAFIPVIRKKIPPSRKIIFVEILVYAIAFTCFIALVHSLSIH